MSGRVGCLRTACPDIVGYGGEQAAIVSLRHKQVVEQGDCRGLPVCSCDSDEGKLL